MTANEYLAALTILSFVSKILKGININNRDNKVPISMEVFIKAEVPSSAGTISSENIKNIVLGAVNNKTNSIIRIKNNIKLRIFPFPGLKSSVFERVNIKKISKKTDANGMDINSNNTDKTIKEIITI
ncbi:MAG: hypothetical protein AB7E39_02150 [Endomicrobiaceae bacterium]